jgi:hypothetical protein
MGHNLLENTRATSRSVCHHHRHGLHPHDVLTHGYTHVVSIIITIIIIHPSHMAWARLAWSCRLVASPELHRLSHDQPNHIKSNTITTIQVLDYATSVPDYLIDVATTQHTRPSHWSSLQLSTRPTTWHEAYNSAQGLQLGTKPTTRHEGLQLDTKAYNSTQRPTTRHEAYSSTRRPTTRHKGLQLGTKAYN